MLMFHIYECFFKGIQSIRAVKPQAAYSTSVTKGDGPQGAMNHTTASLAPLTGYAKIRQTIHENRLRITDQHVVSCVLLLLVNSLFDCFNNMTAMT